MSPSKQSPIVTLLTDFGTRDGYVAAMKGVLLELAPDVCLIDAGHDIPRHDIQSAAWSLRQYWNVFPVGTIHLVVVDPGVGSERLPIVVEADGRILIAPDNGVLGWVLETAGSCRAHSLKSSVHRPGDVSPTFHGRDVFAYAAGLLASGQKDIAGIADRLDSCHRPEWLRARSDARRIVGEVIHIDDFGNLITNITREQMDSAGWKNMRILAGSSMLYRMYKTYSDVPAGQPVTLIGSLNTLEIAVNSGSAEKMLGIKRGTKVSVEKV